MEHTLPSALPSTRGTSPSADNGELLRFGLGFNTALCSTTGAIALAFAGSLGDWMGLDTRVIRAVGAALLLYAPALLWLRSRTELQPWHGWLPAMLDDVWVVAVATIATAGWGLTTGGRWLLAATAVPVAISAVLQLAGAKRL